MSLTCIPLFVRCWTAEGHGICDGRCMRCRWRADVVRWCFDFGPEGRENITPTRNGRLSRSITHVDTSSQHATCMKPQGRGYPAHTSCFHLWLCAAELSAGTADETPNPPYQPLRTAILLVKTHARNNIYQVPERGTSGDLRQHYCHFSKVGGTVRSANWPQALKRSTLATHPSNNSSAQSNTTQTRIVSLLSFADKYPCARSLSRRFSFTRNRITTSIEQTIRGRKSTRRR